MNNQEILKRRWGKTDELLLDFYKKYKKENLKTKDDIQALFDILDINYQDLNKSVSQSLKNRLYRKIEEWQDNKLLKDYNKFYINKIKNKKSITYKEYIQAMLIGIYCVEQYRLDGYYNVLFYSITENAYNQASKDTKLKKYKPFTLELHYLIFNIPILEQSVEDYKQVYIQDCVNEMYKSILINIQNDVDLNVDSKQYKEIFVKQNNRLLDIKKNIDNPTGIIGNITDTLVNNAYLQFGKENGIQQCRFIAVNDKKTTKMCDSLDNQIFNVSGKNKFKRYSALDNGYVEYEIDGMVQGINLPPINNHFHWCRSTITYLISNEAKIEQVRRSNETITEADKEQYSRYKKYFGENISDDINDFIKLKQDKNKWEDLKKQYPEYKKQFNSNK